MALPLRVQLTDRSTLEAFLVGPWPGDFLRLIDAEGLVRYVPGNKVARVLDAEGRDLTRRALDGRETLGSGSLAEPQPPPEPISVPEPFRVKLSGREETRAAFVGPWWDDYVRIIDGRGRVRFVRSSQVQAVIDSTDLDVTRRLIDKRERLGTPPPVMKPWRPPSVPRSPLSGPIAQGSGFIRAGSFDEERNGSFLAQMDLGGLGKLGDRYGLGAAFFFSGTEEVTSLGMKAWGRRLLDKSFVLDLAPGVVLSTDDDYASQAFIPAFVCEAGLTYNRWLSLAGQVEARSRKVPWGPDVDDTFTEWAWYFGLKLGGPAGAPAMLASTLAIIAMRFDKETYAIQTPLPSRP